MRMLRGPSAKRLAAAGAAGAMAVSGAAAGPVRASPVNAKLASAACWASMPAGTLLGGGLHHREGKEYGQDSCHRCVWCLSGGIYTSEDHLSVGRTEGPIECGGRKIRGLGMQGTSSGVLSHTETVKHWAYSRQQRSAAPLKEQPGAA